MNKKEMLILSIAVFITVILWLIYDLYYQRRKQDLLKNIKIDKDITIKFNPQVFDKLKQKIKYE